MSALLNELESKVCVLALDERAHLVEVFFESLCDSLSSEFEGELGREVAGRVAAFDRGDLQTYAADEVLAEARRKAR